MSLETAAALLADARSAAGVVRGRGPAQQRSIGIGLGTIDPYTADVVAIATAADARAVDIGRMEMPTSIEQFTDIAKNSLSELRALADEFHAIIGDSERQWLDKLDDANALIEGAWGGSGGGSGMSGSGSSGNRGGGRKPPAQTVVGPAVKSAADTTTSQSQDDVKNVQWWRKFATTAIAFAKRAAAVACDLGVKMAKSAAAKAKHVVAKAWGVFWESVASTIGQVLVNIAMGYIGLDAQALLA